MWRWKEEREVRTGKDVSLGEADGGRRGTCGCIGYLSERAWYNGDCHINLKITICTVLKTGCTCGFASYSYIAKTVEYQNICQSQFNFLTKCCCRLSALLTFDYTDIKEIEVKSFIALNEILIYFRTNFFLWPVIFTEDICKYSVWTYRNVWCHSTVQSNNLLTGGGPLNLYSLTASGHLDIPSELSVQLNNCFLVITLQETPE